jgi:hypothetical protein
MNMAGMMAGMAMGGTIGQNMAGMMNNMMGGMQQSAQTPPPIVKTVYHVAVNNEPTGPYDINTLTQMATVGSFAKDSLVWKQGMSEWVEADKVQELQPIFVDKHVSTGVMPPIPPKAE